MKTTTIKQANRYIGNRILSILKISIGAMCISLLMACPYESPYPLDSVPKVKFDSSIIGTYINSHDDSTLYEVSAVDSFTLKITSRCSADSIERSYNAYLSKIGSTTFINCEQPSFFGARNYCFYKVVSSDSDFVFYPVSDQIENSFSSSTDLRAFFNKNKDLSFFYTNSIDRYVKIKK
jgi:hypothetical protein